MAVRGLATETADRWEGLNTFDDRQSLSINSFVASNNCLILANGNVMAMRSLANWNTPLATGNMILSASYYDRQAGGVIVFDIATSVSTLTTYYTTGAGNTSIGSFSSLSRWQSVNVANNLFRVNGTSFIQYNTGLTGAVNVGISAPAAAPTTSIGLGGTLTLAVGDTVSYAYRNSTTGHIGLASAVSLASGVTTTGSQTLKVGVVASTQTGVDGIVLFITLDGGSVRYLQIDASGNPVVNANLTSSISISAPYSSNLNVQETIYNAVPPAGINFLFRWQNHLLGCGFTAAGLRTQLVYSGFDQISYGVPWESWPPLNIITIPNRGEWLQCGVETPIGALLLTNRDAYLLNGTLTDNTLSGINNIQFSTQLQQLGWGLGTRSPLTLQGTPFGQMWLDQDKHIQLYPGYGAGPTEIAMGLRSDLNTILDTDAARQAAEARWFQTGDQSGFYVLTAPTTVDSTCDRVWIVTMVKRGSSQAASFSGGIGGQLVISGTVSDQKMQCLEVSRISSQLYLLSGGTDVLHITLNSTTAGPGWASGSQPFFEVVTGNQMPFFNRLHSIRWTGTDGTIVQVRNLDDSDIETLQPISNDEDNHALVNRYGIRQKLRFTFPTDDATQYVIRNLYLAYDKKQRVI